MLGAPIENIPDGEKILEIVTKKKYTSCELLGTYTKIANDMCYKNRKLTMYISIQGEEYKIVVMKEY